MTIYTINDGPEYAPNGTRKVVILRPSDVPGMIRCLDVQSGDELNIERGVLERATREEK